MIQNIKPAEAAGVILTGIIKCFVMVIPLVVFAFLIIGGAILVYNMKKPDQ
jgi:hypothetical protein